MPELTPDPHPVATDDRPEPRPTEPATSLVRDLAWVLGTFLVLGLVAGLVWWRLADPPYYVRTQDNAVMEQQQLGRRIHADGVFVVIGLVASLVAGFALMAWRRRDPVTVLVVGAVASLGAGLIALWLGQLLGRQPDALPAAKVGAHVTAPLTVISHMVLLAWPGGFVLACVATLLGGSQERPDRAPGTADAPG